MLKSLSQYLRMIKFSHSIFALPFAFTAAVIAASGLPEPRTVLWIVLAMLGARSGAMGMNRVIDRRIDAENPRTRAREIPAGVISVASALTFSVLSFALMIFAAYMLNPLCLMLSPVAVFGLVFYSYTKRFTWGAHFVLGVAIAGAPLGAWIAVTGAFDPRVIPLVLAVVFWLPGFDILYALQDREFDRKRGLHSIPARFGVARSIVMSRALHVLSWMSLLMSGWFFGLGALYYAGLCVVAALFIYEHSLVRSDDLSRLNMAFFNMNGYISVTVFVFTFLDYLM